MADNNLDDFFAKRDKKKKTGKKFDTAEELAKILGKRTEERKKLEGGKSQYVSEDGVVQLNAPTLGNEDDEWIDAEEKQPDYTGLKIQELILDDEDEVEVKDPEVVEGTENTPSDGAWRKKAAKKSVREYEPPKDGKEDEPQSEDGSGPVDKDKEETQSQGVDSEDSASVKKAAPPVEDADESSLVSNPAPAAAPGPPTAGGGGKYLPPSQRKAMEAAAAGGGGGPPPSAPSRPVGVESSDTPVGKDAYVPPGRRAGATSSVAAKPRKTTAAPNINDEEYFPSLGGS